MSKRNRELDTSTLDMVIKLAEGIRDTACERLQDAPDDDGPNSVKVLNLGVGIMDAGIAFAQMSKVSDIDPLHDFTMDLAMYLILAPDLGKDFIDAFNMTLSKHRKEIAMRLVKGLKDGLDHNPK